MILNVNARISPKLSLLRFLQPVDLQTVTAPARRHGFELRTTSARITAEQSFVSRNMIFLMGNYTGPWALRFNPFLIARSGRPYNVVSSYDLTGNQFLNNRPSYADASDCTAGSNQVCQTQFGCLNAEPGSGDSLVPMNLGDGPPSIALQPAPQQDNRG